MEKSRFRLNSATLPEPDTTRGKTVPLGAAADRFVQGAQFHSVEPLVKFTVPLDSARHDKLRLHAALARKSMADYLRELIDQLPDLQLPHRC